MPPESDSIASSQQQNVNVPHTTVINSCLAFTKFLMSSRDKVYIREIITSKFDLDSLKKAYEVLHKFCEPDIKFTYQGPRKNASVRDKCVHVFDKFYGKLCELDAKAESPMIACPSEDLFLIFSSGGADSTRQEDRFSKLEESVMDIQRTLTQMMGNGTSSILPSTRQRLMSSASVSSYKRSNFIHQKCFYQKQKEFPTKRLTLRLENDFINGIYVHM